MKDYQAYNDKLFSRWAPIYDGFELLLSHVRKAMVKEIDVSNQSVLDVATGTGSLAIELSAQAKKVVGIDLSAEMLNVAKKKNTPENLSFIQMDASQMDFADNEFDAVTLSLGLHDMPLDIRTAVLKEVRRVLKKDGKLYILEYDNPPNKLFGGMTARMINTFESRYFLDFIKSDFEDYLSSFGFTLESKRNFVMKHLRFMTLVN